MLRERRDGAVHDSTETEFACQRRSRTSYRTPLINLLLQFVSSEANQLWNWASPLTSVCARVAASTATDVWPSHGSAGCAGEGRHSARQVGQEERPTSHASTHWAWNPWLQAGSTRTRSPSASSARQMAHSGAPATAVAPAEDGVEGEGKRRGAHEHDEDGGHVGVEVLGAGVRAPLVRRRRRRRRRRGSRRKGGGGVLLRRRRHGAFDGRSGEVDEPVTEGT
ncbi:hypothetical protein MUK42_29659 [Musa troglodytarum]|uniref:Uncharacterized protein n=1 Tax=Musa troglodytarum TaxID=320322 RepID=A0A9E7FTK6_9LILI|nr:hypothetical protein MUK42_29659 [Musa troglodytarum]